MINVLWMFNHVITEMYDKIVKEDHEKSHALLINFVVNDKQCHMLIYGKCNYKGVYIIDNEEEKVSVECLGYHDSCWRSAPEDFIRENSETIYFNMFPDRTMYEVIDKLTRSIAVIKLRDDQILALKHARKRY